MRSRTVLVVLVLSHSVICFARGDDWITAPSYYTHNEAGQRVRQHTPIGPFYIQPRSDYTRSGYHHTRSSLQFGGSVDHYHTVEEWGQPVRPYDEWRFPYRPYSVPYDAWGAPFAGLGHGYGYGYGAYPPFFPYPGIPFAGGAAGGVPPGAAPPIPPGGNPPGGGGNPPGPVPPGGFPPGFFPGGNTFPPGVPYPGYRPWLDDRYPAFDDRAPWRFQPFPVVPNVP
jgi:hypothetical protein